MTTTSKPLSTREIEIAVEDEDHRTVRTVIVEERTKRSLDPLAGTTKETAK